MEFVISFLLVLVLVSPLYIIYLRKAAGKTVKGSLLFNVFSFFAVCIVLSAFNIGNTAFAAGAEAAASVGLSVGDGLALIAAALATGLSCIGGGIAVAASASAALGAISENEKVFGKSLLFVGLAEGVALYGILISFQILSKIG
jgi:V/A-type H+-transporting ATPase subunit K